MRRNVYIGLILGFGVVLSFYFLKPLLRTGQKIVADKISTDTPAPAPGAEPTARPVAEAAKEVQEIHASLMNFLTVVKDPYRPPLGDNEDITKAMMGGNKYGNIFIESNDTRVSGGRLLDPWGTPLWFHPRAPDAIDVRSAGPDRQLFTADDLAVP